MGSTATCSRGTCETAKANCRSPPRFYLEWEKWARENLVDGFILEAFLPSIWNQAWVLRIDGYACADQFHDLSGQCFP